MNKKGEQLIRDYLSGDSLAFEQLLKIYLKPIYNFLYQLTGDVSQTEDLAQETFVKAWKNIHRFDQNKSFKTWLFTIAKNTAYDYFKKKKTLPFSNFIGEEGYNKLEEIREDSILPGEIIDQKELAKKLEEKLKEIPEIYRTILLLRYKEDFSLNEISEILGKPYSTIKSQHQRALLKLKKAFLENSASERINHSY